MDAEAFLDELRRDPDYAGQIVHVHDVPPRGESAAGIPDRPGVASLCAAIGLNSLYSHQAEAIDATLDGRDVVIATGTASGKTACYTVPVLHRLHEHPDATALMLFPTKALCQDQFKGFRHALTAADLTALLAGVLDGDTPSELRRRLRDHGSVVFTNPDMVHAALMPQHARWADFLSRLAYVVLDEMHVYSGIFGSNMAHLLGRFFRICRHYGSRPQLIATSATIANPRELFGQLTGRGCTLVDRDGSPRGRRVYVFWNPPRIRQTNWRSRKSANVEAHDLMARLIARNIPTITFSKAKMTAEMIHRYVCERLRETAPAQVSKVTPYRGGYLPAERREIETRLFSGQLVGVSTTRALELGIDVGNLEASIIVGYPGTLASFFQQSGRAGRRTEDAVVFLIGLDTSINQFIMGAPDYIFERCIEQAVIDPANPFVATGHLRCATHEMPLTPDELPAFGRHAATALGVLEENGKVRRIDDRWYYAVSETPQHDVSLRNTSGANVLIEDVNSVAILGEVDRFDSEPILHPGAVYMHRGDTYIVLDLDLDQNRASVTRTDVDYYTQPLGGTDIHHVDHRLREKPFGRGTVFWGEVTAHFNTYAFEKVNFYSLDAVSTHGLDLPTMVLETLAFWIVPDEDILAAVRRTGLDAHSGLRAIGYATRMLLPLFMTCDTLDFSHTVGSVNSPWQAVFVYERYPRGLGFTEKAYHRMDAILPTVLRAIETCPCDNGCPCCVGKPLRQYATWNVERGEASIPSKPAAIMILRALLGDGSHLAEPDADVATVTDAGEAERVRRALRRRIERDGEPDVFHPITPLPEVTTDYPTPESETDRQQADPAKRRQRRRSFDRNIHKRIAKKLDLGGLEPLTGKPPLPKGMTTRRSNLRPTDFPGRPPASTAEAGETAPPPSSAAKPPIALGDSLAARARRRRREKPPPTDGDSCP